MHKGQIRKAMSGFYYVYSEGKFYQTRGRGNFRSKDQNILVGDFVEFESTNEKEGVILNILPRKNELVRPAISNIDYAIIVMSAFHPDLSTYLLDRYLVTLEKLNIKPIIYISKLDMGSLDEHEKNMLNYYEHLGYPVFYSTDKNVLSHLIDYLNESVSVLMGQSGAGKSTLLNKLVPELSLKTDDISKHLGRGKHTTRHVEFYHVKKALIADTPGFSSINFFDIDATELKNYFIEFKDYANHCKFRECLHLEEPSCFVKEKLGNDHLKERYEHYVSFYDEIKQQKISYKKKKRD